MCGLCGLLFSGARAQRASEWSSTLVSVFFRSLCPLSLSSSSTVLKHRASACVLCGLPAALARTHAHESCAATRAAACRPRPLWHAHKGASRFRGLLPLPACMLCGPYHLSAAMRRLIALLLGVMVAAAAGECVCVCVCCVCFFRVVSPLPRVRLSGRPCLLLTAPSPPPAPPGMGGLCCIDWVVVMVAAASLATGRDAANPSSPPPNHLLSPPPTTADNTTTALFHPRRALAQSSSGSSRCRVLALPCVSAVYVQAGEGPCAGPSAFSRDNTCCSVVRDFVSAGCACDGAFLAVASFGGWNGAKLAQAVRAVLSTPCGSGLRDPACGLTCPVAKPPPA